MLFSYFVVLETSGSEGLYRKRVFNGKAALEKGKKEYKEAASGVF